MESHPQEHWVQTELREIPVANRQEVEFVANLISKHSWGEEYPVHPLSELKAAERIYAAYAGADIVSCVAITRNGSPDGEGNGDLWFGYAVTLDEYRKQGIFTKLYTQATKYAASQPGRLFACTSSEVMDVFFPAHGWQKIRDTKDEQNNDCRVYEYSLQTRLGSAR